MPSDMFTTWVFYPKRLLDDPLHRLSTLTSPQSDWMDGSEWLEKFIRSRHSSRVDSSRFLFENRIQGGHRFAAFYDRT